MQPYLLSFLIFTPLVAALAAVFIPAGAVKSFRWLALLVSVLQVFVLLQLLVAYNPAGGLQQVEQQPWIVISLGAWGVFRAEYFVGVDGLSLPLVALSVFILLIATI